ncbi:hypothetical protein JTB14_014478 [Gonioctena quinquepunctata]|nr:hypothetical protein JTB14_014478 [Gonioctena quinquepunctata]
MAESDQGNADQLAKILAFNKAFFPKYHETVRLEEEYQESLRQCEDPLSKEPTPGTSNDDGFKIPNKKSRIHTKMETSAPIVVLNKFQALAEAEPMKAMEIALDQQEETVKSVEKPQSIQILDQNISPTNKPPPIFIRDKKSWPTTCQYLKKHGVSSEKNFNTKDGLKMLFSSAEKYDVCKSILDKNKIQYHTFKKIENREIRAIFKGVAEELDTTSITNELIGRGFNPRVVARFENKNGQNMPIILVIVPDTDHKIKEVNQICEMEVRFELQRPRKRVG